MTYDPYFESSYNIYHILIKMLNNIINIVQLDKHVKLLILAVLAIVFNELTV